MANETERPNISPLSPEEIQEIEKRVEATTPGPWYTKKTGANFDGFSLEVTVAATAPGAFNRVYATPPGGHFPAADQDFIAHSREDIPRLIATVKARDAEIERLRKQRKELCLKLLERDPTASMVFGDAETAPEQERRNNGCPPQTATGHHSKATR